MTQAAWLAIAVIACAAVAASAAPIGSPMANEALARCREAERFAGEARERLLAQGMKLAEQAVALDDADAAAHFALFCTLGERLRQAGLGAGMLMDLRRLQREIDRALELAPHDPELWAAKGAMLLNLPAFLGGDRSEAQQWLVRAFVADPDNRAARAYLDEALQ